MKNLREHFKTIAQMQDTVEDADRMFAALIVGADAAIARIKISDHYARVGDVLNELHGDDKPAKVPAVEPAPEPLAPIAETAPPETTGQLTVEPDPMYHF